MNLVGTGCDDCVDGACTMNCSSAAIATTREWIAASMWARVFPKKATADQVRQWRASALSTRSGETRAAGLDPKDDIATRSEAQGDAHPSPPGVKP